MVEAVADVAVGISVEGPAAGGQLDPLGESQPARQLGGALHVGKVGSCCLAKGPRQTQALMPQSEKSFEGNLKLI